MKETFSMHKIIEASDLTFDPIKYSKFKFGCKDSAHEFGKDLAYFFFYQRFRKEPIKGPIVVISSPYCFIPTATFAMKDYFVRYFNELLITHGYDVVEETKIHRTITYKEDYGELSAEQRLKLIENDGFHIDKEFIKDKTLLLLDDIKITGSHEKVIERMIARYGLININRIYIYFAELTNKDIDPKIENELNYRYVKNLLDLDSIIKNENFLLNTRVVKYILNYDHEVFKVFIQYQRKKLVETIYTLAIGNSYHKIPDYQRNLNFIKNELDNIRRFNS